VTERYLFTDSASGTLEYTGNSDVTVDSFEIDDTETVELDSHWNDFFDMNEAPG
jgi:predicted 3-demethylubiquinone-9 3-methyltransferase (glyoxalase superfamily)